MKQSLDTRAPPPSTEFGRYSLRDLLGAGGMGTVYRALDTELDEIVALKILRPELTTSREMVERFRREVKLARRVTHPNVARTFDIGEHRGERYLTMELVEGESLATLLAREIPPLSRSIEIAFAICAGLNAAHAAGIVHRDLKPDNVLLENGGRVVLTDFGIARTRVEPVLALTRGMALGTPEYMAPEQLELNTVVDARADLYALGVMLYEMVTGDRPWTGDSPFSIAAARLLGPPPDPRARATLPDELAEIITRCMARLPRDRFATANDVANALRRLPPATFARRAGSTLACASTMPPPDEGASAQAPDVADLYRLARDATRASSTDANDRAIALFERALQRDEDDPQVNAGYARAMLQRFVETEGPITDAGEICAMADRAIAANPSLAEALLVRAGVAHELGDVESAIGDVHRAKALDPTSAETHQLEGRMLVELGDLMGGLAALGRAVTLDASRASARWDEGYAQALTGNHAAVDALLDTIPSSEPLSSGAWILSVRLASWSRDLPRIAWLKARSSLRVFERRPLVDALLDVAQRGLVSSDVRDLLAHRADEASDVPRRRCAYHQLEAEVGASCRDVPYALASLDRADGAGLFDVGWLERCPALASIRREPRFLNVVRRARDRADRALAVFADGAS